MPLFQIELSEAEPYSQVSPFIEIATPPRDSHRFRHTIAVPRDYIAFHPITDAIDLRERQGARYASTIPARSHLLIRHACQLAATIAF